MEAMGGGEGGGGGGRGLTDDMPLFCHQTKLHVSRQLLTDSPRDALQTKYLSCPGSTRVTNIIVY